MERRRPRSATKRSWKVKLRPTRQSDAVARTEGVRGPSGSTVSESTTLISVSINAEEPLLSNPFALRATVAARVFPCRLCSQTQASEGLVLKPGALKVQVMAPFPASRSTVTPSGTTPFPGTTGAGQGKSDRARRVDQRQRYGAIFVRSVAQGSHAGATRGVAGRHVKQVAEPHHTPPLRSVQIDCRSHSATSVQ